MNRRAFFAGLFGTTAAAAVGIPTSAPAPIPPGAVVLGIDPAAAFSESAGILYENVGGRWVVLAARQFGKTDMVERWVRENGGHVGMYVGDSDVRMAG